MKYRMENIDEFAGKALALGVREVFITPKLSQQETEIPGPRSEGLPEVAASPNIKVLALSGYFLLTARGKEKIGGVEKLSEEFIFYIEEIQRAIVKNDAEAKVFFDNVNKRKLEMKAGLEEQFGSALLGEITP